MIAAAFGLLQPIAFKLLGVLAIAGAVAAVLLGAKQAGRTAERVDQLQRAVRVKDAQARVSVPGVRDLDRRLRDGTF